MDMHTDKPTPSVQRYTELYNQYFKEFPQYLNKNCDVYMWHMATCAKELFKLMFLRDADDFLEKEAVVTEVFGEIQKRQKDKQPSPEIQKMQKDKQQRQRQETSAAAKRSGTQNDVQPKPIFLDNAPQKQPEQRQQAKNPRRRRWKRLPVSGN